MTINIFLRPIPGITFGVCALSLISSCGSPGQDSGVAKKTEAIIENSKFQAQLKSLNSGLAGMTTGKVEIMIDGDNFKVDLEVKNSPTFSNHAQYIYEGTECPGHEHDRNKDGLLDPLELKNVMGHALIPLDGDVSAQEVGLHDFPISSGIGHYRYSQSASWSKLLADLKSPDIDPKDHLGKISKGENFSLGGKIVVIHGVSDEIYLPPTMDAEPGADIRGEVAIACGKLEAVKMNY